MIQLADSVVCSSALVTAPFVRFLTREPSPTQSTPPAPKLGSRQLASGAQAESAFSLQQQMQPHFFSSSVFGFQGGSGSGSGAGSSAAASGGFGSASAPGGAAASFFGFSAPAAMQVEASDGAAASVSSPAPMAGVRPTSAFASLSHRPLQQQPQPQVEHKPALPFTRWFSRRDARGLADLGGAHLVWRVWFEQAMDGVSSAAPMSGVTRTAGGGGGGDGGASAAFGSGAGPSSPSSSRSQQLAMQQVLWTARLRVRCGCGCGPCRGSNKGTLARCAALV